MSVIETLKKIEYQNLPQFLEDVNKNFAVIQNSPLYKGIPGDGGSPGNPGLRGIRGIKFLFVNLQNFQVQFPGELSSATQIDINYINTKLMIFENKQKLLTALNVTELVDKDIIVLSNTIMLSYDLLLDKFINTGIAFNEQSNLLNNIQQQIENYVQYYVSTNQTINNITNIFEGYSTLAKNYSDNNNTFITTDLTASSVYSPYIPGYNSNIGVLLNNHKHFGFSDNQFSLNNNGTIVFGSMKKYYQLLMNTISTDTTQTLTSDYAPGVGNIPSAVFLQDTEKSGLLFGYKSRQNLKRFGSIFKNDLHEVVIKSDSGLNQSEFSELKIHRTYMKYEKLVQFGNDLEVSRDAKLFADISNKFIKSGKFTLGANDTNNFNAHVLELGRKSDSSVLNTIVKNVADFESYQHYISRVLVTDNTGLLSKSYALETAPLSNPLLTNLLNISETINSPFNILTSNYYGYLARKINNISNFVNGNYWRKNQYFTGEIPDLKLNNRLEASGNINLTDMIKTYLDEGVLELGGAGFQKITTKNIRYNHFQRNVIVTDDDGIVSNKYQMEIHPLDLSELTFGTPLSIFSESEFNVISTKYYAHLAKKINGIAVGLATNYYTIDQFTDGTIENLFLSNGLIVTGGVSFIANSELVFNVNPLTGEVTIGTPNTNTSLNSNTITLGEYINNVLVTDSNGDILHTYHLEQNNFNESEVTGNTPITLNIAAGDDYSIPRGTHIRWLTRKLNNLISWLNSNVWYKPQWLTGEIPTLITNDNLKTNGAFRAGDVNNPNISSEGDETTLGKHFGTTEIRATTLKFAGRPGIVVVTDGNTEVTNAYSIETTYPHSGPGTGGMLESEIFADYWIKNLQPQTFQDYPTSQNKVVTSWYIGWIVNHLKAIRTLLFDRPTFTETEAMIGGAFPLGGIVYWNNAFGPVPTGWVVCDGRFIPGIPQTTPNLIDKYAKGSLTPNIVGGNVGNSLVLSVANLPVHNHYINGHSHGFPLPTDSQGVGAGDMQSITGTSRGDETWVNSGVQTYLSGAGYTNNTGTGTAVNIDPHHVTLIPIMKFWNGIGTVPVTVLPPFASITNGLNSTNTLRVDLNVSYVDVTVTNLEVLGSIDGGTTWNVLKVVTTPVSTITNIMLPSNGNWKFKLKATNGDSAFTVGEFSNVFDLTVSSPFATLPSSLDFDDSNVIINITKLDNTVTNVNLMRSTDNINFTNVGSFNISSSNNVSDTVPIVEKATYYYKIVATNGKVLTNDILNDEVSNVCTVNVNSLIVGFAHITSINMTEITNNLTTGIDGVPLFKTLFNIETNKYDTSVTSVRVEYFNPNTNSWITLIPSVAYPHSGDFSFTRNGLFVNLYYKYRLRALNGSAVNTYTMEYQS